MNELVIMQDNQAVTTSLQVAEVFGKRHDHVLRDVEEHVNNLQLSDTPKLGSEMFKDSTYIKRGKEYKCYLMNRDGFSLLAMSFTGKEALKFKLEFISAFNLMEKKLKVSMPTNMIEALTLALEQAKTIEVQNQVIGELQPKADYVDQILRSKGAINISKIAKDYGMSAVAMNRLLHDLNVQFKQGDQWLLYAKYQARGYTKSDTYLIDAKSNSGASLVRISTKWTQKGRMFLYELLKDTGIIPIIERL